MATADVLAIVSLIISITAFIVAVAQALQQFAASAEGYRRCREGIMGNWGRQTKRVFTVEEFRFKVIFHVPVIFAAHPDNRKGPVEGKDVLSVTGTPQSMELTHCRSPKQIDHDQDSVKKQREAERRDGPSRIQRVHTADDEQASWVLLLETLQEAEREGRDWDLAATMRSSTHRAHKPPDSTFVVQVQERRRVWDEMPNGIEKPFATSTLGHVVAISALLGMVWRTFDQDSWNLRADGNGLMLLSQTMGGLGICVSFSKTAPVVFREDRVIPCGAIRYLCFGSVATLIDGLHLQFEPEQRGADHQPVIRQTLRRLHCDRITIRRYLTKRTHIRSVSFEIIAMLGQVFRARGSNFHRLPNPTPDYWVSILSACTLMEVFQEHLGHLMGTTASAQMVWIRDAWRNTLQPVWREREADIDINLREAVHDVLDACDVFLRRVPAAVVLSVVGAHLTHVLEQLGDALSPLTTEHDTEGELLEHYFDVVRPHIIEVREEPVVDVQPDGPRGAAVAAAARRRRMGVFSAEESAVRHDVWITLVFRMCCWWMLHDFDESAVLMIPPRLEGSRLPVFIL